MAFIDDANDWWETVDGQWSNLLEIIGHHLDLYAPAYFVPGDSESTPTGRTILEELEFLVDRHDSKLAAYLGDAWCMASNAYAYSVPGWGDFCDLCSERGVLE